MEEGRAFCRYTIGSLPCEDAVGMKGVGRNEMRRCQKMDGDIPLCAYDCSLLLLWI